MSRNNLTPEAAIYLANALRSVQGGIVGEGKAAGIPSVPGGTASVVNRAVGSEAAMQLQAARLEHERRGQILTQRATMVQRKMDNALKAKTEANSHDAKLKAMELEESVKREAVALQREKLAWDQQKAQIDAATKQFVATTAQQTTLQSIPARAAAQQATDTTRTVNQIDFENARARLRAQDKQLEEAAKIAADERAAAHKQTIIREVRPYLYEGPTSPRIQGAIKAVGDEAMAGALQADAAVAHERLVNRIFNRNAIPKIARAGLEIPADEIRQVISQKLAAGQSPVLGIDDLITKTRAAQVGAANVETLRSAIETEAVGQNIRRSEAMRIAKEAVPETFKPSEEAGLRRTAGAKIEDVARSKKLGRAGIGAGVALVASLLASKMFGGAKADAPTLAPDQQMQLAQMLAQRGQDDEGGGGTSKTMMDMTRLLGLIGKLQTMTAMQSAPTQVSQLI